MIVQFCKYQVLDVFNLLCNKTIFNDLVLIHSCLHSKIYIHIPFVGSISCSDFRCVKKNQYSQNKTIP